MAALSARSSKSSVEKPAAVSRKRSTEKSAGSKRPGEVAEDSRPAKLLRLQGTAGKIAMENKAEICIGYYDANYIYYIKKKALDTTTWIRTCADDVRNAVKDDGLNIVGLVGLGEYAEDAQNLPEWLRKYDSHPSTAILHYMRDIIPGIWMVRSFNNYGIMVNITEVEIITEPQVVECYVQTDAKMRPMVSLTVAPCLKTGHASTVLKNELQVWIVENEGNAIYPLTAWNHSGICRFLLESAAPTAVWGGKMNLSLPFLEDEGRRYEAASGRHEAWTVLPSRTGTRDALVLHRGLGTDCDVEGSDLPCAKLATFFSVSVSMDSGRAQKPTTGSVSMGSGRAEKPTTGRGEKRQTSQLALDLASHADEGDEDTKETVHALLRFLWWGHTFKPNSSTALQEGYKRLNAMTTEIQRVRETYSSVSKPAADYQFSESATREIHNNYKHSHTWMNEDIKEEFHAQKGRKHAFVKGRFNVYFDKTWGCKAFFMHLVRFGTSSDIPAMLKVFNDFRQSKEYKHIVEANAKKQRRSVH